GFDGSIGLNGTLPTGINSAGEISGTYVDANGMTHGFVYSANVYATIDDPAASSFGTIVRGINDNGDIIAYDITNISIIDGHSFGYIGGAYAPVNYPNARDGDATFAFGINNAGDVVGYYVNSQSDSYGFLYSNGAYTTLADPSAYAGGISTFALDINNVGQ